MATVELAHQVAAAHKHAQPWRRFWPVLQHEDGRTVEYDFSGRPWWGGEREMTNEELRQAHDLAKARNVPVDEMYWLPETAHELADDRRAYVPHGMG